MLLSAARTAVFSFTKAKEASTREKDLFRSVKVKSSDMHVDHFGLYYRCSPNIIGGRFVCFLITGH